MNELVGWCAAFFGLRGLDGVESGGCGLWYTRVLSSAEPFFL